MLTPLQLKLLALSIYGSTKRERRGMETVLGALFGVIVGLLIAWWIQ